MQIHHEQSLKRLHQESYIHVDETSYVFLTSPQKKVVWVWILASQDTVVYELALSRGKAVLEKLFPDGTGAQIAVVDGWHVYRGFF